MIDLSWIGFCSLHSLSLVSFFLPYFLLSHLHATPVLSCLVSQCSFYLSFLTSFFDDVSSCTTSLSDVLHRLLSQPDLFGRTPLEWAVLSRSAECCALLLRLSPGESFSEISQRMAPVFGRLQARLSCAIARPMLDALLAAGISAEPIRHCGEQSGSAVARMLEQHKTGLHDRQTPPTLQEVRARGNRKKIVN